MIELSDEEQHYVSFNPEDTVPASSINLIDNILESKEAIQTDNRRDRFSSEYERNILSVILHSPLRLAELRHKINDNYFLYEPNRIVYTAICSLVDNPAVKKIDLASLHLECKNKGLEAYNIGPQYLALIYQGLVEEDNFEFYLTKLTNAYQKYKLDDTLKSLSNKINKNITDSEDSLSGKALIDNALASITNLNLNSDLDNKIISIGQRAEPYVLERARNEREIIGLETGFKSLDLAINGLCPGTLTIVAGRAKAGKSAILMNILEHLTVPSPDKRFQPVKALIISTEMYTDEDISRLVAMTSYVEERKIANGQAYKNQEEREAIQGALNNISRAELYHVYLPYFNAEEVCSIVSYAKLRYNIDLAVFDYIKMETASMDENKNKREDQVMGDIANALKMIAGRLHIPVLSGCQINNNHGKIADSDRLVRYASTIVEFKVKDKEELEEQQPVSMYGTHWLTVTHCRSGRNRKIPVSFYKPCLKILEAKEFNAGEDKEDEDLGIVSLADTLITPRKQAKLMNNMFTNSVVNGPTDAEIIKYASNVDKDDMF